MTYRTDTTSEARTSRPFHHIDAGFINRRKCFSVFGTSFREHFDKHRKSGALQQDELYNDHLMITMCLDACKNGGVPSLAELLHEGPQEGDLFCSTEKLEANERVWVEPRCKSTILLPYDYPKRVSIEYSTEHIYSSTTRSELSQGCVNSIIAEIRTITDDEIIAHPLVIGAPTYDHLRNKDIPFDLTWSGWDHYQVFAEDIREFSAISTVQDVTPEDWMPYMQVLPEKELKNKLCEILGDIPKPDWAGEQDDHFTAALHLGDTRLTGAFLLKGPSCFEEMQPRHLGKQGDQVYRLAATPAQLLIVQHCHNIGEAVRDMLRVFAVQPHRPRHYCLIDGKDSYRLLKAYHKL